MQSQRMRRWIKLVSCIWVGLGEGEGNRAQAPSMCLWLVLVSVLSKAVGSAVGVASLKIHTPDTQARLTDGVEGSGVAAGHWPHGAGPHRAGMLISLLCNGSKPNMLQVMRTHTCSHLRLVIPHRMHCHDLQNRLKELSAAAHHSATPQALLYVKQQLHGSTLAEVHCMRDSSSPASVLSHTVT